MQLEYIWMFDSISHKNCYINLQSNRQVTNWGSWDRNNEGVIELFKYTALLFTAR